MGTSCVVLFYFIIFGVGSQINKYFFAEKRQILNNKDFSSGEWQLIKEYNGYKYIIKESKKLEECRYDITAYSSDECTQDGILRLYKDGKLIEEADYLDDDWLEESNKIKEYFKEIEN